MGKSARNGVSPIATFDHQMVISSCSNRITKNDSPVETPKYLSLPKNRPSTAKRKKNPLNKIDPDVSWGVGRLPSGKHTKSY